MEFPRFERRESDNIPEEDEEEYIPPKGVWKNLVATFAIIKLNREFRLNFWSFWRIQRWWGRWRWRSWDWGIRRRSGD
jgi:hypothetical protein